MNVALQTLLSFHLYCEEVIDVPLNFPPRSKLIVECVSYLMEVLERVPRERVKPVVGNSLEVGRERSTEKEIIMSIDRHLVLVLTEMYEGLKDSRVVVKGWHQKLLRKAEHDHFLQ